MNESELRTVAAQARQALEQILEGDTERAAAVRTAIDMALALPPGRARLALFEALSIDNRVQVWALARLSPVAYSGDGGDLESDEEHVRGAPPSSRGPVEVKDPGESAASPVPAQPQPRYLHAHTLERVETGRPLTVRVLIARAAREPAARPLRHFEIPPEGATVRVLVSAPEFVADRDLQADLVIPAHGDSDPHIFELTAGRTGLHTIKVEAFREGTFLGVVQLQVSVENNTRSVEGPVRVAEMSTVAFEPGEVTLTVERGPAGYRFQLLGSTMYEPVMAAMGDPTTAVTQLATELREMATNRSPYREPEAVRRRLRNLGVALWAAAVPGAVREQFWKEADRIKIFTIAATNDTIPFELLYAMDGPDDLGFIAEQFPVVRRAYASRRVMTLPMGSAAYIVPPGSPGNALAEASAIQQLLGSRVVDRGVLSRLESVADIVLDCPGILHFACHNAFTDSAGSSISLDGGPWAPTDLSIAVQQVALAAASPLVFLNACRSAGESDWFSQMSGWAKAFVQAGAGAFIGSLWAVRSSSALVFAEAFYRQFVELEKPLGESSLEARRAIVADSGDPTWLAYSVYGNPAARSARSDS